MKITRLFMLAGALLLAACTDDGGERDDGKISVVDWATEMARASEPDTIQDKFEIVIDTEDPTAFNAVIEIAKEQAAAEAAENP
jgi:hypothetical protein